MLILLLIVFILFLNVYFCGEFFIIYGIIVFFGNDRILIVCFRIFKEFCDSFIVCIEMFFEWVVFKRVVVWWINIVILFGVVYMIVVKRSVIGVLKCYIICIIYLRKKGCGKIYILYRS